MLDELIPFSVCSIMLILGIFIGRYQCRQSTKVISKTANNNARQEILLCKYRSVCGWQAIHNIKGTMVCGCPHRKTSAVA